MSEPEHNMLTFKRENMRFTYRIAGVVIHNGRVLAQYAEQDNFYFLPGGRAEFMESAQETLRREMAEELGLEASIERLLWIAENLYTDNEIRHHEIALYFLIRFPSDAYIYSGEDHYTYIETTLGYPIHFAWLPLEKPAEMRLYPEFLRSALLSLPEHPQHILNIG